MSGAPIPITRAILYFGRAAFVACDALCSKAWGISRRPKINLSVDPDDYAYLADQELGEAPDDPGTYEGGHAKPQLATERLNKWCVRECERCIFVPAYPSSGTHSLPNFGERLFNMPHRATSSPASSVQGGR